MSAIVRTPHVGPDEVDGPPTPVLAVRGGWRFTRVPVVGPADVETFYRLYTLAFNPLKTTSVARQVLTETEFRDQMADERVEKYIAWDTEDRAVGLSTLTKHLEAIPWISPDYFKAHYPDHWRRNAIWYLGFTLAHPSLRHRRFMETIFRVGIDAHVVDHSLLAYDVCAYNNETLRFEQRIEDLLSHYPMAKVAAIDTQTYYSVEFT